MSHVFISYKHDDAHFVDSLREKLEAADIETWVDTDIEAGEDWKEKIDTAIEAAFAVVVVLTPESHQSPYVTYEWSYAMGLGKQIIQVLLRKTDRHPKLEAKQYLDFTERKSPEKVLIERLHNLEKSYTPIKSHRLNILGGQYGHLQPLIDDLKSSDLEIRLAAIATLGELKAVQTIGILIDCLREENNKICKAAVIALGKIGSDEAIPVLMAYASRQSLANNDLEKAIYRSLAQIGGTNTLNFIYRNHILDWKARWQRDGASYGLVEAVNLYGNGLIDEGVRHSMRSFVVSCLNILISDTASNFHRLERIKKEYMKFTTSTTDFDELYEHFHLDKEDLVSLKTLSVTLDINNLYLTAQTKLAELEQKLSQLIDEE